MGSGGVIEATTLQSIEEVSASAGLVVLHFWAAWCEPCKHMDMVLSQLAKDVPSATFLRVEAEVVDAASIKYEISSVPTFILLKGSKVVGRIEGADPAALTEQVLSLCGGAGIPLQPKVAQNPPQQQQQQPVITEEKPGTGGEDVQGRIKFLVSTNPVLLFMKGTPDAPRCGFSRKVVDVLKTLQVPKLHTVDVLQNETIRSGIKVFSDWPTVPQLYVQGEFVGGCDIVLEMQASGDMEKLFIDQFGADYRKGLKASDPTPPSAPPPSTPPVPKAAPKPVERASDEKLKALVSQEPVMLFMKGNPTEPRCGFSRKVVESLQGLDVPFGTFDILGDEGVRNGLKEFSNWPTFPQVYVKGELLGGCDIVLQLKEEKQLKSTVEEMLHRMGA